jgi:predicted transcriptional regulator
LFEKAINKSKTNKEAASLLGVSGAAIGQYLDQREQKKASGILKPPLKTRSQANTT